jgi:hypothetical protein
MKYFFVINVAVRLMEENEVPFGLIQSRLNGLLWTGSLLLTNDIELWVLPPQIIQDLGSGVGRVVIDHNDLYL